MQKLTFGLVLLAGNLLGIPAYSQFVPSDVPLNNLINERAYNFSQPNRAGTSANTNATAAASFITDSDASLEFDYMYTREWFEAPGISTPAGFVFAHEAITKINSYNTAPSVFFAIRSKLLVTAGFDYLHQNVSGNAGTQAFDDYTPFVCADEELLHFLPQIDATRNSLFLGGNFSYTRGISGLLVTEFVGPGGLPELQHVDMNFNNYSFGPSLVYIRSVVDWSDGTPGRASFTLNPAYSYNYDQAFFRLERNGAVSVLGRVDYGLTRNLYLNISGTWMHRNNIDAPSAHDEDWAVFGGGLTARVLSQSNHLVLFRLAYNYEAFMRGLESHEVSAQLEFHF